MDNINVEQIMEEIRKEIKDKGMTLDVPSFEDVPLKKCTDDSSEVSVDPDKELDEAVLLLENECEVAYYYDMPRGIKNTIKKVIRKTVHCVFYPIMESQNRFNRDVVQYLRRDRKRQAKKYRDLAERIKRLEVENKSLKRRLNSEKTSHN